MQSGNKRSLREAQTTDDSEGTEQSVLVKLMDERKRQVLKVVMYLRSGFRHSFGIGVSNKHGHFLDYHLSRAVLGFADWLAYPKGDHFLDLGESHTNATAVSEDGYHFFVGYMNGSIMVWDLIYHTKVREWSAHSSRVVCLAHRCGILVSAGSCFGMKVWNSHTHRLIHNFKNHCDFVSCLDINAKGNLVVSGHHDSSVHVWSVKNGRCLRTFSDHRNSIYSVMFSEKGIISGCDGNTKYLWDVSPDSPTQQITVPNTPNVLSQILLNCDESMIALVYLDRVLIHSWPELNLIREMWLSMNTVVCFHPQRPELFAWIIRRWVLQIHHVIHGSQYIIPTIRGPLKLALGFTPDGSRLISFNKSSKVMISDLSCIFPNL